MKCLIADPSATQRRVIRNVLTQAGWDEIVEASDGKEALERFGAGDFRLAITEWDLPGFSGVDLVAHLRGNPETAEMPILMVTTRNTREDVVEAVRAGVRQYLLKPFSAEVLRNRIDEFGIAEEHVGKEGEQEQGPERSDAAPVQQAPAAEQHEVTPEQQTAPPGPQEVTSEQAEPQTEEPIEERKAA
jgi:two-component system, chemotaxis family, chemotaxis protein CheY